MNEFRFSFPASLIAGKSRLSAEDLMTLRKVTFPDGIRTPDDAITLLALQNACLEKCEQWNTFFVEALAEFVVHHSHPQGLLSENKVDWLICMLSDDGVVKSPLELEAILHIIEVSSDRSTDLSTLALDQLRLAITRGAGAYTRPTDPAHRPCITLRDLDYINRILRAAYDRGRLLLSAPEIAVLSKIAAATSAAVNHPGWEELMACVQLREEERPRTSRWLRVSDDIFASDGRAA